MEAEQSEWKLSERGGLGEGRRIVKGGGDEVNKLGYEGEERGRERKATAAPGRTDRVEKGGSMKTKAETRPKRSKTELRGKRGGKGGGGGTAFPTRALGIVVAFLTLHQRHPRERREQRRPLHPHPSNTSSHPLPPQLIPNFSD